MRVRVPPSAHMKQIIFVTGNQMKVRHANEAVRDFGYEFVAKKLEIIEPLEEEFVK